MSRFLFRATFDEASRLGLFLLYSEKDAYEEALMYLIGKLRDHGHLWSNLTKLDILKDGENGVALKLVGETLEVYFDDKLEFSIPSGEHLIGAPPKGPVS